MSAPRRVAAGLALVAVWAAVQVFYVGRQLGPDRLSPDGRYVVRLHQVLHLDDLAPTMPGDSPFPHVWMRLYDASGRKLREEYCLLADEEGPRWSEDAVYLLGDGPFWELP